MQSLMKHFNLYFAAILSLALLCGCETDKSKSATAAMRVHLETPNAFDTTQTISVMRNYPVKVTIAKEPIFSEANLLGARLIETPGGYAIEMQLDERSSLMLEQYSASNVGRHFVIFAQWGKKISEGRWIAAPLISHHIANGVLSFTPDTSREEAEQFVLGLNNVAKKLRDTGWKSLFQ